MCEETKNCFHEIPLQNRYHRNIVIGSVTVTKINVEKRKAEIVSIWKEREKNGDIFGHI